MITACVCVRINMCEAVGAVCYESLVMALTKVGYTGVGMEEAAITIDAGLRPQRARGQAACNANPAAAAAAAEATERLFEHSLRTKMERTQKRNTKPNQT